ERGGRRVGGAGELVVKEPDGIETVRSSLRALGVRITETEDGFVVRGVPTRFRGGAMDSHGDHRIAMLGAVAGLVSRDGVEVGDWQAGAVSFPRVFEVLGSVTQTWSSPSTGRRGPARTTVPR